MCVGFSFLFSPTPSLFTLKRNARSRAKYRNCTHASLAPPSRAQRPPANTVAAAPFPLESGQQRQQRQREEEEEEESGDGDSRGANNNNACSVCLSRGRPEVTLPLIILAAAAAAAAHGGAQVWKTDSWSILPSCRKCGNCDEGLGRQTEMGVAGGGGF